MGGTISSHLSGEKSDLIKDPGLMNDVLKNANNIQGDKTPFTLNESSSEDVSCDEETGDDVDDVDDDDADDGGDDDEYDDDDPDMSEKNHSDEKISSVDEEDDDVDEDDEENENDSGIMKTTDKLPFPGLSSCYSSSSSSSELARSGLLINPGTTFDADENDIFTIDDNDDEFKVGDMGKEKKEKKEKCWYGDNDDEDDDENDVDDEDDHEDDDHEDDVDENEGDEDDDGGTKDTRRKKGKEMRGPLKRWAIKAAQRYKMLWINADVKVPYDKPLIVHLDGRNFRLMVRHINRALPPDLVVTGHYPGDPPRPLSLANAEKRNNDGKDTDNVFFGSASCDTSLTTNDDATWCEVPHNRLISFLMTDMAVYLANCFRASIVHVQDDEITLVFVPKKSQRTGGRTDSQYPFGGRTQRICSLVAGSASAWMTSRLTFLVSTVTHSLRHNLLAENAVEPKKDEIALVASAASSSASSTASSTASFVTSSVSDASAEEFMLDIDTKNDPIKEAEEEEEKEKEKENDEERETAKNSEKESKEMLEDDDDNQEKRRQRAKKVEEAGRKLLALPPLFDVRVFPTRSRSDAFLYMVWRQCECRRHAEWAMARSHFKISTLKGCGPKVFETMLKRLDPPISWDRCPPWFIHGRTFVCMSAKCRYTPSEIEVLSRRHPARFDPTFTTVRQVFVRCDLLCPLIKAHLTDTENVLDHITTEYQPSDLVTTVLGL